MNKIRTVEDLQLGQLLTADCPPQIDTNIRREGT